MVQITAEAEKFIDELLEKNQKVGWGIKVYLSGYACSGPQFGMSFQQGAKEGEQIDNTAKSFEMYYDEETA
ncbi:MAG: iron-sulfur cluster assembly accessory protein, partial [Candidatus Methanomethylophilus sp.]|nr:iron-sulfur cluster assembly accessory protein [Methanomethylophilus sp.]